MGPYVLAIDQGTTSSRAILFDEDLSPVAIGRARVPSILPRPGWVEQDPEAIWQSVLAAVRACLAGAGPGRIAAIGIANQRETAVIWERRGGRAAANAIVWQDRRTAPVCDDLRAQGLEPIVRERTGLVLDPYFSATKWAWMLDAMPDGRRRARAGELAFGTVDSWLLHRLSGGRVHRTDATNAARTALFDIHRQAWDDELLAAFGVPAAGLPEVVDSSGALAETEPSLFGRSLTVGGVAGDQQAALLGLGCTEPGAAKTTYGTGAFVLVHTGAEAATPGPGLLGTVALRLGGRTTYALEGSVFAAGSAVDWLRDGLGLIRAAEESESVARSVPDTDGVYLVPAFGGLGSPHWDPYARGLIVGLSARSDRRHVVRAALEGIAYQCRDVIEAMGRQAGRPIAAMRVDGGAIRNDFLAQCQADIAGIPVERLGDGEATARGAAVLAGLSVGLWPSPAAAARSLRFDRRFEPTWPEAEREAAYAGWREAVSRARDWARAATGGDARAR